MFNRKQTNRSFSLYKKENFDGIFSFLCLEIHITIKFGIVDKFVYTFVARSSVEVKARVLHDTFIVNIIYSGDNLIVGSYDRRLCWFDMDLSTKPYKTLR